MRFFAKGGKAGALFADRVRSLSSAGVLFVLTQEIRALNALIKNYHRDHHVRSGRAAALPEGKLL